MIVRTWRAPAALGISETPPSSTGRQSPPGCRLWCGELQRCGTAGAGTMSHQLLPAPPKPLAHPGCPLWAHLLPAFLWGCTSPSRSSAVAARAPGRLPRGAGATMPQLPALQLPPSCSFEVASRWLFSCRRDAKPAHKHQQISSTSSPASNSRFHSYFPAGFGGENGFSKLFVNVCNNRKRCLLACGRHSFK